MTIYFGYLPIKNDDFPWRVAIPRSSALQAASTTWWMDPPWARQWDMRRHATSGGGANVLLGAEGQDVSSENLELDLSPIVYCYIVGISIHIKMI